MAGGGDRRQKVFEKGGDTSLVAPLHSDSPGCGPKSVRNSFMIFSGSLIAGWAGGDLRLPREGRRG